MKIIYMLVISLLASACSQAGVENAAMSALLGENGKNAYNFQKEKSRQGAEVKSFAAVQPTSFPVSVSPNPAGGGYVLALANVQKEEYADASAPGGVSANIRKQATLSAQEKNLCAPKGFIFMFKPGSEAFSYNEGTHQVIVNVTCVN